MTIEVTKLTGYAALQSESDTRITDTKITGYVALQSTSDTRITNTKITGYVALRQPPPPLRVIINII